MNNHQRDVVAYKNRIFDTSANISSYASNYHTQNTPLRVGATLPFRADVGRTPAPEAFCVMLKKRCTKCKLEKPRSEFHKQNNKSNKDGLNAWCKKCTSEYNLLVKLRKVQPIEDLPGEVWKPINKDASYFISNLGRFKSGWKIFSLKSGKVIRRKPRLYITKPRNGYLLVDYIINDELIRTQIHRLVAYAFLPNPECKPFINHKDGNRLNNSVKNLEWCTQSENMEHSYYQLKKRACINRPVLQLGPHGDVLNTFRSVNEAARALKLSGNAGIWRVLNNKQKKAYGYEWKYL